MTYISGYEELSELILSKGYTKKTVATALEIAPSTFSKKLRGSLKFTFPERVTMAFMLEVAPDTINRVCSKIRTEYQREKGEIE